MPLTTINRINTHLPTDKGQIDDVEFSKYVVSTNSTVRGMLSGTFTLSTLDSWIDEDTTPEEVQEAVAFLIAGMYYNKLTSEEYPDGHPYGNKLFDNGISILSQIKSGLIILPDVVVASSVGRFLRGDFYPTKSTSPMFTIDSKF